MTKTIISEIFKVFKKKGNSWRSYTEIYALMDKSVFGKNKYGEQGKKNIVSRMISDNTDFRVNKKSYPRKYKLKSSTLRRLEKPSASNSKSGKGKLLKGMTKPLPKEILQDPVFEDKLKEIMKEYGGIYALYSKNKPYYVGLTVNFDQRINAHLNNHHENNWDSFAIFHIKKIAYLKDIETIITRIIDLKGNIQRGKVPRNGDINRELKKILKGYEKNAKKIKNAILN